MTSVTITPNQRIIGNWQINQTEYIDTSLFSITQVPIVSRPDVPNTFINNTTSSARVFLGSALFAASKVITLSSSFSIELYTDKNTFLLDNTNTPITLTYDTTNDVWQGRNSGVAPSTIPGIAIPQIQRQPVIIGANSAPPSSFGQSMAYAQTAGILAVGAPDDFGAAGSVFIFTVVKVSGIATRFTLTQKINEVPIDPSIPSGYTGARFGNGLAISADASILVIGAPGNNPGGRVSIYVRNSSGIYIKAIGTPMLLPDSASENYGFSAAVSDSGNTIVIGATGVAPGGAVYIYERTVPTSSETWLRTGRFAPVNWPISGWGGQLGYSVSISGDGNFVVAGVPTDPSSGADFGGFATLRRFKGGSQVILPVERYIFPGSFPGVVAPAAIGAAVTVSGTFDSGYIIGIGAPRNNLGVGAVWTYSALPLNGYDAVVQSQLLPVGFAGTNPPNYDGFGASIYLNRAANMRLIVGRPVNSPGAVPAGALWYYEFNGTIFSPIVSNFGGATVTNNGTAVIADDDNINVFSGSSQATFGFNSITGAIVPYNFAGINKMVQSFGTLYTPGPTGTARQGTSVALSVDGNFLVQGGPNDQGTVGALWVFGKSAGGAWTEVQKLLPNPTSTITSGQFPQMGAAVTTDSFYKYVYGGGPNYFSGVGAVYAYQNNSTDANNPYGIGSWVPTQRIESGTGIGAPGFGSAVSTTADGLTLAIGGPFDDAGVGAFWVYEGAIVNSTIQFTELQKSTVIPIGNAGLGSSIVISKDGLLLAASAPYDDGGVGAVFVTARLTRGVPFTTLVKIVLPSILGRTTQNLTLAMSANSQLNTVLIVGDEFAGRVLIYTRPDPFAVWTLAQTINNTFPQDRIGVSVALNSAATVLLVGCGQVSTGISSPARVFVRDTVSGLFVLKKTLLPNTDQVININTAIFGRSVSISGTGDVAVIGAPRAYGLVGCSVPFN